MNVVLWENKKSRTLAEVDALIVLFSNEQGSFYFISGPENLIHGTFIRGCLERVYFSPDTDKREEFKNLLGSYCSQIERPLVKGMLMESQIASFSGLVDYAQCKTRAIIVCPSETHSLILTGLDNVVVFAHTKDNRIDSMSSGWGLEKKELMFLGAEVLFGEEVGEALRDVVYGVHEITSSDGQEIFVDHTEIMRGIMHTMRVNRGTGRSIALDPATWNVLAGNNPQNCMN